MSPVSVADMAGVISAAASVGTLLVTLVALAYAHRQLHSWKRQGIAEAKAQHGQRVLLAARNLAMLFSTTRRAQGREPNLLGVIVDERPIQEAKAETLLKGADALEEFRKAAFLAEVFWPTMIRPIADRFEKQYFDLSFALRQLNELGGDSSNPDESEKLWGLVNYVPIGDKFEASTENALVELKELISRDLSFEGAQV